MSMLRSVALGRTLFGLTISTVCSRAVSVLLRCLAVGADTFARISSTRLAVSSAGMKIGRYPVSK